MKHRSLFLIIFSFLVSTAPAIAQDCVSACVDVYTQDGQLIFEARKGSGPTAGVATKPVVKPKIVAKPKVVMPRKVITKPKLVAAPTRKVIKKSVPIAATSLSDRLSKSLPTGGISYQPSFQPLINTPVYFWNDIPAVFRSQVNLIGESIDVLLHPSFIWAFGDGSFSATTDPGGPYPAGKVTHIYANSGTYPVVLVTTWAGSFTHNAIERAITGEIKKTTALTITVAAAPSRFMQPTFFKK